MQRCKQFKSRRERERESSGTATRYVRRMARTPSSISKRCCISCFVLVIFGTGRDAVILVDSQLTADRVGNIFTFAARRFRLRTYSGASSSSGMLVSTTYTLMRAPRSDISPAFFIIYVEDDAPARSESAATRGKRETCTESPNYSPYVSNCFKNVVFQNRQTNFYSATHPVCVSVKISMLCDSEHTGMQYRTSYCGAGLRSDTRNQLIHSCCPKTEHFQFVGNIIIRIQITSDPKVGLNQRRILVC